MNTYSSRIIACSAFIFLPLSLAHAQDTTSLIQQKQQEMMQANMAKDRKVNNQMYRSDAEQEEMFRAKMRKIMMEKMRQSGKAVWEPTEWQKTLPPIVVVVEEGGVTKEYSFTELIEADGYLCPGSARAYKTLLVALPLLYPNSVPIKGDFKITHGSSLCITSVYKHFMAGFIAPKFLEKDRTTRKKPISIERLSTGKKVTVVFGPSGVQGHNEAAAQAGDAILRAQEGQGMTVYVKEG